MTKRTWSTIISSAIIIGAGAGGVFWIHQHSADQLQDGPRLAVVAAKETENAAATTASKQPVKKTRKQIIEESQKKVVRSRVAADWALVFSTMIREML